MIDRDSRPKRRDDILTQRLDDSQILLNLVKGMYYELDDVGARVWELCDGNYAVSEMVALLCQEYDAPPDVIGADLIELLEDLSGEGMLAQERG